MSSVTQLDVNYLKTDFKVLMYMKRKRVVTKNNVTYNSNKTIMKLLYFLGKKIKKNSLVFLKCLSRNLQRR